MRFWLHPGTQNNPKMASKSDVFLMKTCFLKVSLPTGPRMALRGPEAPSEDYLGTHSHPTSRNLSRSAYRTCTCRVSNSRGCGDDPPQASSICICVCMYFPYVFCHNWYVFLLISSEVFRLTYFLRFSSYIFRQRWDSSKEIVSHCAKNATTRLRVLRSNETLRI